MTAAPKKPRSKVLETLRKLHRKYESIKDCSTEAEAQEFARKIQELLTEHKISMSEVEYQELDDTDPIIVREVDWTSAGISLKHRRIQWHELLASCVTRHNYCRLLVSGGSSKLWFVGRRSDVEPTILTYLYLVRLANDIADKEYVRYFLKCRAAGHVEKARGFRTSFLDGFCIRLNEKYSEEEWRLLDVHKSETMALIRLTDALKKVDEHVEANVTKNKSRELHMRVSNSAGFMMGRKFADKVTVRKQGERLIG